MRSEELRIGNLVNTPNTHMNPFRIESIEKERVGGYNSFGSFVYWNINDIEPISLTKNWLIDFGFDSIGEKLLEKRDFWQFIVSVLETKISIKHPINIYVYHVHCFQNLYFSITKKELEKIIP